MNEAFSTLHAPLRIWRSSLAKLLAFAVILATAAPVWAQPEASKKGPTNPDVAAAKALVDDEKFYDAFGKLADMMPNLSYDDPDRPLAQLLMGKVLFSLNLFQSALRSFDLVQVPQDHPLYSEKMRYYLRLQRAVPGDLATIERLSDAPEGTHRKEDLDEIRFLLGRYYYNVGDMPRAIEQLTPVKITAGEIYLKSRHLLGTIYVKSAEKTAQKDTPEAMAQGKAQADMALEAFKDVLRFEEQVGSPKYYPQYHDLASMSLGRLFYTIGQFETAGRYYDRVREGSSTWLDSLFELGWTYFRLGRIDRVLGQLHTLNSPYFEDRYYPEARVLESLILFRTCRFSETLVSVQRFLRDYKPLKKELDAQLAGQRSDAEFYDYLAELAGKKAELSVQLRRIFNAALSDKRLQRQFAAVALANDEMSGLEKLERNTSAPKAAAVLKDDMGRVRAVMIAEAGGLARARLARVREELTEIIRQGLRIKYESLKARRGSISDSVREDMAETARQVSEQREDDDEHIVWPFDGSYWKDELGGYTYDTRSRCTAAQMPKGTVITAPVTGKAGAAMKKAGATGADKKEEQEKADDAGGKP